MKHIITLPVLIATLVAILAGATIDGCVGEYRDCQRDCLSMEELPDNPICRACEVQAEHPEFSIVISN